MPTPGLTHRLAAGKDAFDAAYRSAHESEGKNRAEARAIRTTVKCPALRSLLLNKTTAQVALAILGEGRERLEQ